MRLPRPATSSRRTAGGKSFAAATSTVSWTCASPRRRQRELDAQGHLRGCGFCSALAAQLAVRRRPLAVLWPFTAAAELLRKTRRLAGRRPVHVAVGLAGTVAVGILVARAVSPPPAPPPGCVQGGAISEGGLAAMGQRISVSSGSDLRQHVGQDVMVCSVSVT